MRGVSRRAAGKEVVRYEIGVHNFMANTGFTFSRAELSAAAVTNAGWSAKWIHIETLFMRGERGAWWGRKVSKRQNTSLRILCWEGHLRKLYSSRVIWDQRFKEKVRNRHLSSPHVWKTLLLCKKRRSEYTGYNGLFHFFVIHRRCGQRGWIWTYFITSSNLGTYFKVLYEHFSACYSRLIFLKWLIPLSKKLR